MPRSALRIGCNGYRCAASGMIRGKSIAIRRTCPTEKSKANHWQFFAVRHWFRSNRTLLGHAGTRLKSLVLRWCVAHPSEVLPVGQQKVQGPMSKPSARRAWSRRIRSGVAQNFERLCQARSMPSVTRNSFGVLFSHFNPRCHVCSSASANVSRCSGFKFRSLSTSVEIWLVR